MCKNRRIFPLFLAIVALSLPGTKTALARHRTLEAKREIAENAPAVLWRKPSDISSRNLFYGPGGKEHQPHGPFTFLKEDLAGSNPKFDVQDSDGVTWKVKLGEEARPETVASRLVWAVKRKPKGEQKIAVWRWRHNPFTGTRELNGLRVVMALINNWDLKDENNAVYEEKPIEGPRTPEQFYEVSDLGASFGTTGRSWTRAKSKGNLRSYSHSSFIAKITPDYVDFNMPTRPAFIHLFELPEFVSRIRLRWIGRHIPREDARWIGQLLVCLSPGQVRAAFRAGGYSAQEVEAFTKVVQLRIAELSEL